MIIHKVAKWQKRLENITGLKTKLEFQFKFGQQNHTERERERKRERERNKACTRNTLIYANKAQELAENCGIDRSAVAIFSSFSTSLVQEMQSSGSPLSSLLHSAIQQGDYMRSRQSHVAFLYSLQRSHG